MNNSNNERGFARITIILVYKRGVILSGAVKPAKQSEQNYIHRKQLGVMKQKLNNFLKR